jgi:hypothetical protein
VVDPHRLLVDVRLERVEVVRERGEFVGHRRSSLQVVEMMDVLLADRFVFDRRTGGLR